MGGSGKTTLTKAILHRVHQGFQSTSFVANMRDSKNVLDIQRQLLKDLKYASSILTIEEGFKCLQNIFENKRCLLFLMMLPRKNNFMG
jgi:ABC-type molybdenum transport system ATPase subunit/photorepair protein PhrA